MSKDTGRSTPFKLSFKPEAGSTNSGADTRSKILAALRADPERKSFDCF